MVQVLIAVLAVMLFWCPARAQLEANPNAGAVLILKDGNTERAGEVLADLSYGFALDTAGNRWGELVALYGLGDTGGQLGGLGVRAYFRAGEVFPGLGAQLFIVDQDLGIGIAKTSVTVAPELLLEIPWLTEVLLQDGTTAVEQHMISAYGAVYFPVSGDTNFTMVRFGLRADL